MRPDPFFFPHEFTFNDNTYYGQKDGKKGIILITLLNDTCPFDIGDVLVQRQGEKERLFEVLDYDVNESLGVGGGGYPYLASLQVKAQDVKEKHPPVTTHFTFNAAVNAGRDFQAGSINSISNHISIQQLQEAIEQSDDPEVKSLWQKLLENPTFSTIASALAQKAIGG